MNATSAPSRAYLVVGVYALAVFSLGALSAVPMHQWLVGRGLALGPMHEWTADWLKILALAGIPGLLYVAQSQWRDGLGLDCNGRGLRHMGVGFVFGAGTMALACALLVGLEVRVPRAGLDAGMVGTALAKAALTAALVSAVEELWFRGALHRVLRPVGATRAVITVASIYAALHFLRPDVPVPPPHVVMDGVSAVGGLFSRFTDVRFADSALALLMAGLALGWLRVRCGCIAACFGCHFGWVLVLQTVRRTTQSQAGEWSWLAGRYDGIIGWAFIAVLLVAGLLVVAALALTRRGQRDVKGMH